MDGPEKYEHFRIICELMFMHMIILDTSSWLHYLISLHSLAFDVSLFIPYHSPNLASRTEYSLKFRPLKRFLTM